MERDKKRTSGIPDQVLFSSLGILFFFFFLALMQAELHTIVEDHESIRP